MSEPVHFVDVFGALYGRGHETEACLGLTLNRIIICYSLNEEPCSE